MKKIRLASFQPIVAVAAGLALGLLVVSIAGENPLKVLMIILKSSMSSRYDFGMTLFYSTPLILCGLSVSMAYRAGLLNIGAEGQLLMGALGASAFGIYFPGMPWPLAPIIGTLVAFVFGAAWGGIAGALRVFRGSHEVITTIMLNFIAAGLTSWFVLYPLKDSVSQDPETSYVGQDFIMHRFSYFQDAPVTSIMFVTVLLAVAIYWMNENTRFGFELKCVGDSEDAAHAAGIKASRIRLIAFCLAGGLAGIVGAVEVFGNSGRFKLGFSPDYGFTGIAVALLARGNPIGVIFSGLLFGALQKGSLDLDIETDHITREVSMVIQGLVILTVAADGLWQWMKKDQVRKLRV